MNSIAEPPKISAFAFEEEIFSGDDAQLLCYVAKGDLPLTIRWNFHDKEISHVMGVTTMKVGSRSSILTITSASHGHSGDYTCDASNAAGKQTYTASLIVHGSGLLLTYFDIEI